MSLENTVQPTDRLVELGWNAHFDALVQINAIDTGFIARVVSVERDLSRVQVVPEKSLKAEVSGKLRFASETKSDFPAVGDWVVCSGSPSDDRVMMTAILERKNAIKRTAAGETSEQQVIASNVDWMFIATALDGDYSLRRVERYIALAYNSGVTPIVVLTKSDLVPPKDLAEKIRETEERFIGVPVLAINSNDPETYAKVAAYLDGRKTGVIVGSSGVGKSTLTNRLLGDERLLTQSVREEDSKGRHTTTRRELFLIPSGGIVIDTPGMRELQLTGEDAGVATLFADIELLAGQCHFGDCGHETEPGCAVQKAITAGEVTPERFASYRKLQAEVRYLERRQDKALQAQEKEKWKKIHKAQKEKNKSK
ncbi:MAG: ribosome small subunit-dependent GTPase A [Bdellovibrionota bacterium]